MRFVDLFAGLGGFHIALAGLGHECVLASEVDAELAELYESNLGMRPHGDIRNIPLEIIPEHDILCAGFPCQPFSKAGEQRGRTCPQWGDLFDRVIDIVSYRKPSFLLLENVPNLLRHSGGATWASMRSAIESLGYDVDARLLSPHTFGVPQARDRAIIVASRAGLHDFDWPGCKRSRDELDIRTVLDHRPPEAKALPDSFVRYIEAWQSLLDALPPGQELPSFPIWAMEFGATYPYADKNPAGLGFECQAFKGAFGQKLRGLAPEHLRDMLPAYARSAGPSFPEWKKTFIRQNRRFYSENKVAIDRWLPSIKGFAPSFQKLEWNWKGGRRDLWGTLIQFRASGIRAKRPSVSPSLVALTTSQVPVIPWEQRYMTERECARLQSMGDLPQLPAVRSSAYRALGNAVNVTVIRAVAEHLFAGPVTSDAPTRCDASVHMTPSSPSPSPFEANRRGQSTLAEQRFT